MSYEMLLYSGYEINVSTNEREESCINATGASKVQNSMITGPVIKD